MNYSRRGSVVPTLLKMFNDACQTSFEDAAQALQKRTTAPLVNVENNEDSYKIEVAAPGLNKDDFQVKLENGVLSISAEQKQEEESTDDAGNFVKREFNYSTFKRSFKVDPKKVDDDKMTAAYNNGILTINLPKREEEQGQSAKTIEIS